jgi:hypothetical protein
VPLPTDTIPVDNPSTRTKPSGSSILLLNSAVRLLTSEAMDVGSTLQAMYKQRIRYLQKTADSTFKPVRLVRGE